MTERKTMTLGELFARRAVEIKAQIAAQDAYRLTPEGKAQHEAWKAQQHRMAEADAKAWAARTPYQQGSDAACSGDEREPPEDMDDESHAEWLEGFDAESESEEDPEYD
jgi:hypothetical protein